ncbi:MAG: hypothetical protein WD793_10805 [Steroidobacteraceae bacterium]
MLDKQFYRSSAASLGFFMAAQPARSGVAALIVVVIAPFLKPERASADWSAVAAARGLADAQRRNN